MKIVNSDKWAPRDKLNLPMSIRVYYYDNTGLVNIDRFYYRLVSVFYYNILNENGYFDEDD
jgi:hypothetical protein